jgi:hypothetical protein
MSAAQAPVGKQLACAAGVEEPAACREFTERRIDLVRIARITGFVLPIVPTADAQVHDEDNGDEAKSNESGNDEVHGWGVLRVPFTSASRSPRTPGICPWRLDAGSPSRVRAAAAFIRSRRLSRLVPASTRF